LLIHSQNNELTLNESVEFNGIGIHSGKEVSIKCKPQSEGGIVFTRTDLKNALIEVHPEHINGSNRASILTKNNHSIYTPEHLLSALSGLNIDHLSIEINSPEVPILDGSSKNFIEMFLKVGTKKLSSFKKILKLEKTISLNEEDSWIRLSPTKKNKSRIQYELSYPNHFIKTQIYDIVLDKESYCEEIAPARTYGFKHEIDALIKQGLAKGGSLDNAVVIGETDYLNKLRFEDECVRHKILDLIGDFSILGFPILADIEAYKSGHSLNLKMVKEIYKLLQI
tara:strand:- start:3989 stop:4834 length:846 start_codon:yes stop_codon:yes gene_type:complete